MALSVRLILVVPTRSRIRAALEPTTRAFAPGGRRSRPSGVPILGGLFDATEAAFGEFRWWRGLELKLDRSPFKLDAPRFFYLSIAAGLGLGLLAAVAALPTLVIVLAMLVGGTVPYLALSFSGGRRLRAFEDQLPDTLDTLAALLKGGQGLQQAFQAVGHDSRPPVSIEISRALRDVELGLSVQEALANMAERVGSTDLNFVVNAIAIQSQVGGSLAGLFEQIATTVRERHRFARRVQALTAQGRMSARILTALPVFVVAALAVVGGGYIRPLYTTRAGVTIDVIAAVLLTVGALTLRRIVSFKA